MRCHTEVDRLLAGDAAGGPDGPDVPVDEAVAVAVGGTLEYDSVEETLNDICTSFAHPRMITSPTPSAPTSIVPVAFWPALVILRLELVRIGFL
jgi:hypothetical protein